MNIIGIFILFAHWSDCVRNDKVFTMLLLVTKVPSKVLFYIIVMHMHKTHIRVTYISVPPYLMRIFWISTRLLGTPKAIPYSIDDKSEFNVGT